MGGGGGWVDVIRGRECGLLQCHDHLARGERDIRQYEGQQSAGRHARRERPADHPGRHVGGDRSPGTHVLRGLQRRRGRGRTAAIAAAPGHTPSDRPRLFTGPYEREPPARHRGEPVPRGPGPHEPPVPGGDAQRVRAPGTRSSQQGDDARGSVRGAGGAAEDGAAAAAGTRTAAGGSRATAVAGREGRIGRRAARHGRVAEQDSVLLGQGQAS
mmetsp:Transcript_12260/g.29974  ORF Transcript_12260/g.29974 Transcript_12260/m.29974 type:complete len:214 (-) Transcript_12260:447-1088(-)